LELYTYVTNGFVLLMIAVFMRHSLYRLRFFLHMFQQVGYKTNEMRQWLSGHLFSNGITPEHLLYNIIILLMAYYLADRITLTAGAIVMGTFTLFWFSAHHRYKEEKEKKPMVYTPRMKRLALTILVIIGVLWYILIDFSYNVLPMRDFASAFIHTDPYFLSFGMILIDMLVPFFLFIGAYLMKPLESFIQNGFKKKARKKLESMPGLKVVAITGSYGKTSTKFVMDAFLKERMNVCVTPGSYNTPMGICKVINNDLEAKHQVLILEMGARYEGNIRELCKIAKPDMAVITNVGISHLETFGTKEAIAKEKSTLAKELKTGGTLILNGDDPAVRQMANIRNDVNIVMTGMDGEIQAYNIKSGADGTSFVMKWADKKTSVSEEVSVRTKLLGSHNIQNLLLGAAVAREFSIRLKTVAVAASKMEPVEHRLELKNREGLLVIDDAFNSNPTGAKSAVNILDSFPGGRKIIITPGMIELGELEEEENERFGRHIGNAAIDLVILVGEEQTKPILNGIRSTENGRGMVVKW
jgi:UDP-N-acetylmuramoyl-tripeptide--D-alanyl-D-alanine ligase